MMSEVARYGIIINSKMQIIQGNQRVAELWQQSGLRWSEFVPEDIVDEFLNETVSYVVDFCAAFP